MKKTFDDSSKLCGVAAAIALTSLVSAQKQTTIHLGDPAPALQIAKWIKGTPVPAIEKNQIYVVEFWATWCGPCKQAIPHLTELAHRYGKDVTFIGVDAFETKDGTNKFLSKVASFVKDEGDSMDYHVGADDMKGVMGKTWMDAAGQSGIPTAFIVGRDSHLKWLGNPMEMEKPLSEIVNGTYDLDSAKKKEEDIQARSEARAREFAHLNAALKSNDNAATIAEVDRLWSLYPKEHSSLFFEKSYALEATSSSAFNSYVKQLASDSQNDREMLWTIAWEISDPRFENKIKDHDYPLAISCVKRAIELSKAPDWNLQAVLGMAYFGNGQFSEAVEAQEKCLALLKDTDELGADNMNLLRAMLKKYQQAKR